MTIDAKHPHQAADQMLAEWRDGVSDYSQAEIRGIKRAIDTTGCKRRGCVTCAIVRDLATLGLLQALCAARDLEQCKQE